MKLKIRLKKIIKKARENLFSILSLLCASVAIYYAQKTMELSISQFEQNAINSDSLFNVQLDNAINLNDSLIIEFEKLQTITNGLLKTNELQLNSIESLNKATQMTLDNIIYSQRPNLSNVGKILLYPLDDTKSYIRQGIDNIGLRTAHSVKYRKFVISKKEKIISQDVKGDSHLIDIESNQPMVFGYEFIISKNDLKDFYFCYEFSCFDNKTSQTYYYTKFKNYTTKDRMTDNPTFFDCTTDERNNLLKIIDSYLLSVGEPEFQIQNE